MKRDTTGCRQPRCAPALAAALLCLMPALPTAAMTAFEAFAEGNRLYRDDLYWAALLRYRQAGEAGMNTPLLHYNTGVAHYRAQQHIRARRSLLKAAQSASLRVISHYNLGLNAYAAGDIDAALNWFRQARDQEDSAKIHRLAIVALSRLLAEKKASDPMVVREKKRRTEKKITDFDLHASIGFGTDDNVYRSPNQPYVDFSDPNLPIIYPEVTSGVYVPVGLRAKYSVNSLENELFFGAYRLSGRYYQDADLDSANEFSHEIRFGSEFNFKEENRERRVYSAFSIAQHDETYYDPDDGLPRSVGGVLIDERLNYVRYGPELTMRSGFRRLSFGLRIKGQLWNYDETVTVPEYDHEYLVFGGNLQYKFTATSLLRLSVERSSRRYGDRPSFDLNGQQLITNPSLRYDYLEVGLLVRQRITNTMWFGLGYESSTRTDRYLGYNNYTRDSYNFEFHWLPGRRFDVRAKGYYRIYDYPNAFAFHNPAAGPKTLETADGSLTASYRMTPRLSLVGEVRYRGAASTDTRIAYDRYFYSLGVMWQQ